MTFKSSLLGCLLVLLASTSLLADVTVIYGRDISPRDASPVGENGVIYKLTVTPARESSPAFKYRFTVPPHETIPGNSITHYLRSLGENSLDSPSDYLVKEFGYDVYDWISPDIKAEDIPLDSLKKASGLFDAYVENHLKRATICRDTDWGVAVEDFRGIETVGFLLPSVQQTRQMARVLLLQNRLAITEKRYVDAVDRLRMTYQLGHNVNQFGPLVTSLIGIAETGMANNGTLLLIASDESPNLYWALAELPTPVIDVRRPMRLEASMPMRTLDKLIDIEKASHTDSEWRRLLKEVVDDVKLLSQLTASNSSSEPLWIQSDAIALAAGFAGYSSAKERLIESGYAKEQVDSMHVAQVILVDAARDLEYFTQESEKLMYLPGEVMREKAEAFEERLASQSGTRFGAVIAGFLLPATAQVHNAALRTQAEVNVLMGIESLRNHAAVHSSFPDSLDDLDLPVRDNPFTGKPFNYTLEGNSAVISYQTAVGLQRRYEIRLKQ